MEFLFQGILKANKNIKEMANENMSLWCRHWGRHGDGGGDDDQHGRG